MLSKLRKVFVHFLFIVGCIQLNAQTPLPENRLPEYVVIGYPGIRTGQLDSLKLEYAKHPEIVSAKYVYGTNNCLLIKMDLSVKKTAGKKLFLSYYDIIKPSHAFYPIEKCYLKPASAYLEIEDDVTKPIVTILK
jgi:hypothetical protein